MAEFCLDCWNELNETNDNKEKYVLSKELELCEGCGQWKHVIVSERNLYYGYPSDLFLMPFEIIFSFIKFLIKLSKNRNKNH